MACVASSGGDGGPDLADSGSDALVSFRDDVLPIFGQHCVNCHAGETPQADLDLSDPDGSTFFVPVNVWCDLGDGDPHPDRVVPGDPDGSPLVWKIREDIEGPQECGREMPANGMSLGQVDPEAVATIVRWIDEGAALD